ncbi:MAG: response regulator [Myxococcales bacterium]|nr:response regulator [Myxococcales bacterium]
MSEGPDLTSLRAAALPRDESFARKLRGEIRAGYQRATWLSIALILSFAILDATTVAQAGLMYVFWALRAGICALLVLLLRLSEHRRLLPHVELIAMVGAAATGGVIALMSALYMGHESYYYAGMSLTLVAVGILVPVGPASIAGAAATIFVSFLVFLSFLDPTPLADWNWNVFVANSIFLIVTAAVVVIGAFINRRLRRRAFDAAWEQERASEELRLVNERVKQSYLEISEKNREIEDAYRSKSQFLDNISHELRTPLTCILTPLEGLLAGNATGEVRGVFEDMHSASRQLYDLINDLLDYSKYGSRDQPTQRDPVDLRAVIDEHVRSFKPTARQRMLTLEWDPPSEPLIARGSARELGKVVRNLLSNAVKFTPFGGRITVTLGGDDLAVSLKVVDTGIGMSPEVQAKLFTPFFQGDATSTRAFEGTGIGLALVKTIVNRHDGGIAVSSVQGQGTTMTVTLPRSPLDPTELAGMEVGVLPPAQNLGASSSHLMVPVPQFSEPSQKILVTDDLLAAEARRIEVSGPPRQASAFDTHAVPDAAPLLSEHLPQARVQRSRILVIDDHPEIVRLIARLLSPLHDIITASNGEEGLQKVHDERPDLVISDVMMPKMSGFQLVERLREDPETARLPVLLLTARADGHDRVRGLRRGASDYLIKPFLPEELKARVDNLLRHQHYESYMTRLNEELEANKNTLEGRVHGLFVDTVRTLVAAIDAKDTYTGGHSERVSFFSVKLAEQLRLPRPMIRTIELGALLHDVGKIGIPDRVLNKPGALSLDEIEIIRQHTIFGGQILEKSPELAELRRFALHHHERWDGTGYPDRLAAVDIPQSVRVVSVADCWDAMVSDRIYRAGMEPNVAAEKVARLGGTQFDPEVVEAMMAVWRQLELPPNLRPLKSRMVPHENRASPRVSECGEVYHVHE